MRNIIISLILVAAYDATGQITAGQIRGIAPYDSLQLLVNDTVTSSPYYKRGKWLNAYLVIGSIVDSLYPGLSGSADSTWLTVYDSLPPPFAKQGDSLVHIGPITIGADTIFEGAVNIVGRIDMRWPIDKDNVAIGGGTLQSGSVTGDNNVAIGHTALRDVTSGQKNSALGAAALQALTTGSNNLAVGEAAGQSITTGQDNVAVGQVALGLGGDPDGNVAMGREALYFCGTDFNVAIGYRAIGGFDFAFTGGDGNVAIGTLAGYGFAGEGNVAMGDSAGYSWTGSNALIIDNSPTASPLVRGDFAQDTFYINGELGFRDDPGGADALALMAGRKLSRGTVGYGLVLAGDSLSVDAVALADSIGGATGDPSVWYESGAVPADNIADEIYHTGDVHIGDATMAGGGKLNVLGRFDQKYPTLSLRNVAIGDNTLNGSMTGDHNVGLGTNALRSLTSGSYNVGVGLGAGDQVTSGTGNVAMGFQALFLNQTSSNNVALGYQAAYNTVNEGNVALGVSSLYSNTSGSYNMAIGPEALNSITTGSQNIGLGYRAGRLAGGSGNVFIGGSAGENVAGNFGVYIGYQAGQNETGSNKLYIDNSNTTSPLIHGDFSADELFINGKLGYSTEGGTATTLAGRDASEDFTNVTIGTGISLSGGTLSNTGVITEVDGSITNEGSLTVGAGTGTTSLIQSNTSGSTAVTLQASGIITLAEAGNTITIGATETDGSITNEGILGVGAGGATSATLITNTSTGNPVTINVAGILAISESTSSNGGSITMTATEVDGSITNELELFQIDGVLQSAGPVTFDFDGASFAITESPANDFDIQIQPERVEDIIGGMVTGNTETGIAVTYDDPSGKLNFVVSGGSADGNGIFDAANDGGTVPSDMDVNLTDHLDFELGLLYIDGASLEVGINTQTPASPLHVRGAVGSSTAIATLQQNTSNSSAALKLFSNQDLAGAIGSLYFNNTDATSSQTDYRVGEIVMTRTSASAGGGSMSFNVAYDYSGASDNILNLVSRAGSATDGIVSISGGMRHKSLTTASLTFAATTGDYYTRMTGSGAKTFNLPATSGAIIGQVFEIYNDAASGDITLDGNGSDTINGSTTVPIPPGAMVRVFLAASGEWKLISF